MIGNVCPKCSTKEKFICHTYDYTYCDGLRGGYEEKKVEENKSWDEFIKYVEENKSPARTREYEILMGYEKIGLLIEYLKSKGYYKSSDESHRLLMFKEGFLDIDNLENAVKHLKPKEDDEVEKLAKELCKVHGNQFDEFINQKQWWIDVAKKAIEIIRGEI